MIHRSVSVYFSSTLSHCQNRLIQHTNVEMGAHKIFDLERSQQLYQEAIENKTMGSPWPYNSCVGSSINFRAFSVSPTIETIFGVRFLAEILDTSFEPHTAHRTPATATAPDSPERRRAEL
jgi:hypothetical protein